MHPWMTNKYLQRNFIFLLFLVFKLGEYTFGILDMRWRLGIGV